MLRYIIKRLCYVGIVFFLVSILMFGIYKCIPGDPARMMLDSVRASTDPERYELMYQAARKQLGLDQPLVIQYVKWITNMLRGDFGYSSMYRMKVSELIVVPMKNTIRLNLCSLFLVFLITIPIGICAAVHQNSIFDRSILVLSVLGYSLPTFLIALIFIYFLAVRTPVFPINGMNTPGAAMEGWPYVWDTVYHMCLPVIVMTVSSLGGIIRYIRTAMIEVLRMDYIRTARAKGLSKKVIVYCHAFRNALIPIITIITSWFVGVFGGSVVIESIFGIHGIGKVLYDALKQQDYAVVLAMQMFYVVISLLGNLLMDLSVCLVDPRVKL